MHTMNAAQFTALKNLMDTLDSLVGDETCDHDVNICYCGVHNDMYTVKLFIRGEES